MFKDLVYFIAHFYSWSEISHSNTFWRPSYALHFLMYFCNLSVTNLLIHFQAIFCTLFMSKSDESKPSGPSSFSVINDDSWKLKNILSISIIITRAAWRRWVIKCRWFFSPSTSNFSLVRGTLVIRPNFFNFSHALFNDGFDCRSSLFSIEYGTPSRGITFPCAPLFCGLKLW